MNSSMSGAIIDAQIALFGQVHHQFAVPVHEHASKSLDAALALGEFYVSRQQTAKAEAEVRRALRLAPKKARP